MKTTLDIHDELLVRAKRYANESDNHLIELAVAGNAAWIVTGNTKDIAAGELVFDSFRIITPRAWLERKGD